MYKLAVELLDEDHSRSFMAPRLSKHPVPKKSSMPKNRIKRRLKWELLKLFRNILRLFTIFFIFLSWILKNIYIFLNSIFCHDHIENCLKFYISKISQFKTCPLNICLKSLSLFFSLFSLLKSWTYHRRTQILLREELHLWSPRRSTQRFLEEEQ